MEQDREKYFKISKEAKEKIEGFGKIYFTSEDMVSMKDIVEKSAIVGDHFSAKNGLGTEIMVAAEEKVEEPDNLHFLIINKIDKIKCPIILYLCYYASLLPNHSYVKIHEELFTTDAFREIEVDLIELFSKKFKSGFGLIEDTSDLEDYLESPFDLYNWSLNKLDLKIQLEMNISRDLSRLIVENIHLFSDFLSLAEFFFPRLHHDKELREYLEDYFQYEVFFLGGEGGGLLSENLSK